MDSDLEKYKGMRNSTLSLDLNQGQQSLVCVCVCAELSARNVLKFVLCISTRRQVGAKIRLLSAELKVVRGSSHCGSYSDTLGRRKT